MKHLKWIGVVVLVILCGAITVSCKGKKAEVKPVKGVLEEPVNEGKAPELVVATLDRHVLDKNFEMILNDTVNHVQVWSLVSCDSVTSSEGFGIVIAKDGRATIFADIRHGNTPAARYNASTGELWLTGVSVEGTGTHVERFYKVSSGSISSPSKSFLATVIPVTIAADCKPITPAFFPIDIARSFV